MKENARKLLQAVAGYAADVKGLVNGEGFTLNGVLPSATGQYDRLYNAIQQGDAEEVQAALEKLDQMEKSDRVNSELKKRLKTRRATRGRGCGNTGRLIFGRKWCILNVRKLEFPTFKAHEGDDTMLTELRAKSQITIPRDIVAHLGLSEGDKLEIVERNGAIQIIPVAVYPKKYLDELRGEIDEAKAKVAAGEQPTFDSVDALFKMLDGVS